MFEKTKSHADQFIDQTANEINNTWGTRALLYGAATGSATAAGATHAILGIVNPNLSYSGKNLAILGAGTALGAAIGGYMTKRGVTRIVDHFRDSSKILVDHTIDKTSDMVETAKDRALDAVETKSHGLIKKQAVERIAAALSKENTPSR
jgi:hypothetical protein